MAKKFFIGLILICVFGSARAETCGCGPIEDISFLPDTPTSSDFLVARAGIRDFSIVYQEAGVVDVDLLNNVIDLTVVTTDMAGTEIDQVHLYPIGQLPSGTYTFNLFVGGLNPSPIEPPGPQLVFTTIIEISGLSSVSVPIFNGKGIGLLVIAIAFVGGLALRSTAMDRGEVA